jgi:hypothetical protein
MAGKAHHADPRYRRSRPLLLALANADPLAVCCRDRHGQPCGLRLEEHPVGAKWTCGHTVDGSRTWALWLDVRSVPPDGDWLAPQASTCNYAAGASAGNRRRNRAHSRRW